MYLLERRTKGHKFQGYRLARAHPGRCALPGLLPRAHADSSRGQQRETQTVDTVVRDVDEHGNTLVAALELRQQQISARGHAGKCESSIRRKVENIFAPRLAQPNPDAQLRIQDFAADFAHRVGLQPDLKIAALLASLHRDRNCIAGGFYAWEISRTVVEGNRSVFADLADRSMARRLEQVAAGRQSANDKLSAIVGCVPGRCRSCLNLDRRYRLSVDPGDAPRDAPVGLEFQQDVPDFFTRLHRQHRCVPARQNVNPVITVAIGSQQIRSWQGRTYADRSEE